MEADGYEPLISGPYPLDEKVPPLEILLEKLTSDSAIFATVLLPDGSPAEGVQVVRDSWVAPPNFSLMNGRYDQIVVTDADGKFMLPKAGIDSDRLYFLHPQGFTFRDMETLSADPVVRLEGYGKLEIHMDYDPAPHALNQIQIKPDYTGMDFNALMKSHAQEETQEIIQKHIQAQSQEIVKNRVQYERNIPEDGVIVFERFAPGKYILMVMAKSTRDFNGTPTSVRHNIRNYRFSIDSGENKIIDLRGDEGEPINTDDDKTGGAFSATGNDLEL